MTRLPISIFVTHIPEDAKRRRFLAAMEASLGGKEAIKERVLSYKVYTDTLEGKSQRHRHARPCAERAWRKEHHPDATHVLGLQDDIICAGGFFEALAQILEARPDDIVSLMTLRGLQKEVYEQGDAWMCGNGGLTGQAILIPRPQILAIWDWADLWLPDVTYSDMPISAWAMAHQRKLWFTVPSLVEHLGASDSLIGHSNNRHVAGLFFPDVSHVDFRQVPKTPASTGTMNFAGHYRKLIEDRREVLRVTGVS